VNIACFHCSVSSGQIFQKYSYVSAARPLTLTLDRVIVGHAYNYGLFCGLRLSLARASPDNLSPDCGALGQIERASDSALRLHPRARKVGDSGA
jgi:hypothetical protein